MGRRYVAPLLICFLLTLGSVGLAGESVETSEYWNESEHEVEGLASWYGGKFQGRQTANGEIFDTNALTAAHKTLPFGTIVEVTHLTSGRRVEVRINDRGPFVEGRIIDLSRAAADELGMAGEGVSPVRLRIVSFPPEPRKVVQLGSFGVRENARRVAARLRGSSLVATIEEAVGVYRVVIAAVPESRVETVLEELAELGFESVLVRD